ncbi:uncharacterized protein [Clytia hemisphaerica]|uniref:uncharacterized protein n=1 Tax=Clytia hemisphaerica TaxID=252671 RepID=UPI0034D6AF0E
MAQAQLDQANAAEKKRQSTYDLLQEYCSSITGFQLRKKQLEGIESILTGRDTLCILPTNYGKSVIFQLMPLVFKKFKPDILKPTVLVISPILSLIESTVRSCNEQKEYGLKVVALDSQKYKSISKGDFNVIVGTPEAYIQQRQNLCLHVVNLETKSVACFDWMLSGLKEHGESFPKVIIYCRSILGICFLIDEFVARGILTRLVNKYMKTFISPSFESEKKKALESLLADSSIRVVLATSALGCGVNAKDVEYIIHYGPAYDTVDYVQQIGRGGRITSTSSIPVMCHAVLYTYPGCKGGGHISKRMQNYINNASERCLRVELFSPLNPVNTDIEPSSPAHACCSYCAEDCECDSDRNSLCSKSDSFIFIPQKTEQPVSKLTFFRDVDADQADLVRELLVDFAKKATSEVATILPNEAVSGVTTHTINSIIANLHLITSMETIFNETTVVSKRLAHQILVIVYEIFYDIEDPGVYTQQEENFALTINNLTLPSEGEETDHCSDEDFFCLDD